MLKVKLSGIYSIKCLINGKEYVGSSKNIISRWSDHMLMLRNDKHHSPMLQRSWNKHGKDNFVFKVVELCDIEDLFIRENYHIDYQRMFEGVFNAAPVAGSCRGIVRGPMPQWHIDKLKEASKHRPAVTDETRKKLSEMRTGKKLKPLSDSHKAAISAVHKGKIISQSHREILSKAHKGKPLSEDHKRKKSESAKLQHERQRADKKAKHDALLAQMARDLASQGIQLSPRLSRIADGK